MNRMYDGLKSRWQAHMPVFYSRMFRLCSLISGTALAINTAVMAGGGALPEWWNDIYPYLLGIPAGMAFAAKFSQSYDSHGQPLGKSGDKELRS